MPVKPEAQTPQTDTRPSRDQQIQERAYHLWERAGRAHGQDDHHWAQAAREIDAEAADAADSVSTKKAPAAKKAEKAPAEKPATKAAEKKAAPLKPVKIATDAVETDDAAPKKRKTRTVTA